MAIILSVSLLVAGCAATPEPRVETKTVIVGPPVVEGDANSFQPAISGDGRFVAFTSDATNLLMVTTFGRGVFMKDTGTGVTTLVSSSQDGSEGSGDSESPSVSGDGRFVAFESDASDLVANDTNDVCTNAGGLNINCRDVFLKDTQTGVVTVVSSDPSGIQGNGASQRPSISRDGRFVAFYSTASNLVAGDDNESGDIFIKDTQTGALQAVSADAAGVFGDDESDRPSVSADGRFVAFYSTASNLVDDDGNGAGDVFIKDTQTGAVTLVSSDSAGAPGNKASGFSSLAISGDGRFVVFESEADNLVEGDVNEKRDVFIKDTQTGAVTLASSDSAGAPGDDDSFASVDVTDGGRFVFFSSNANNLFFNDTVNKTDIFIKDTRAGATTILSTDTTGNYGDGASEFLCVSAHGLYLAFSSDAANLVADDTNGKTDIFLKNTETGETVRVSTSTAS